MKKEYTREELLHKAASYCSLSEHCVFDVEEKLILWNAQEDDKQFIINKLLKDDFINEKRYATAFVNDKFKFNKWGKIKISMALKQKRVDNKLIENALNSINEDEYDEVLAAILKTKLKTLKWKDEYEKTRKLFAFAQSRGFENALIDRVIQTM